MKHPASRISAPSSRPRLAVVALMAAGMVVFSAMGGSAAGGPAAAASAMTVAAHPTALHPAADAAAPQLSITITDGQESTSAGSQVSYSVSVQNLGSSDASTLTITQSLPDGVSFVSADSAGTLDGSTISWEVNLKAAETTSLSSVVAVGETPADLLRLATTVCAAASTAAAPIVCASDSDLLPAGAQASVEAAEGDSGSRQWAAWAVPALIALTVLLIAAAASLIVRHRKRKVRP